MSDTVAMALITAATLVILFLVFRNRLTRLLLRFKQIEAQVDAAPPQPDQQTNPIRGILIRRNKQVGTANQIDAKAAEGEISDNFQKGNSNALRLDNSDH
ncbi:MAG TPA: hypothetical protein VLX28_12770 [Thermoanaerobaculia bacterium]|nr:hypothetical protein [Thermoanaerobaculia bacterium]